MFFLCIGSWQLANELAMLFTAVTEQLWHVQKLLILSNTVGGVGRVSWGSLQLGVVDLGCGVCPLSAEVVHV